MIVNSVIWPNGKTVHVRVYDETDSNLDVDYTATGVTEVAVTDDYSRYKYDVTVEAGHEYTIDFKTIEDSPYFTSLMLRRLETLSAYVADPSDPVVIGDPASASNIRVYDYFYEADDATPVTTLKATAKIKLLPYDYNGKIHIGDHVDVTYSSVTGLGYWDIVKGATVEFRSNKFFDTLTKTLPTTGTTIRLSDM